MQLNLVGVNVYAKTNFGYLPNFKMTQIVNPPLIERSPTKLKTFLFLNAEANGPSFMISKRTYGLGFFMRARAVVDARRIPYELATALLNGEIFDPSMSGPHWSAPYSWPAWP